MKKKIVYLLCLSFVCMTTACGESDTSSVGESTTNTMVENYRIEISITEAGKAYDLEESGSVLDSYDTYNIQVPVERLNQCYRKSGFHDLIFIAHTVEACNGDNSENGKYDVVDTISLKLEAPDPYGVLPQTITEVLEWKRDAKSQEWFETKGYITKWDANYKKLGGTTWKLAHGDEISYIRFRNTIDFFSTRLTSRGRSTEEIDFATDLLGVLANVSDGDVELIRLHVMSGTICSNGDILLNTTLDDKEQMIRLTEYELCEKEEFPATDEEFAALGDHERL